MTTSRLNIYNKALTMCGSRTIASLSDNCEARRVMDTIWDNGAIDHCLEQGYWNFAMRTVMLDSTSEIEPDFGYQKVFEKPSDWVRTYAVCSDEYFNNPLTEYADEVGYLWTDIDPLYLQYVSNGSEYGSNMGHWPQSFIRYIEAYMAAEAAPRLTMSEAKVERLKEKERMFLSAARSQDAMNEPAKFKPLGSWAQARLSGSSYYTRNSGS